MFCGCAYKVQLGIGFGTVFRDEEMDVQVIGSKRLNNKGIHRIHDVEAVHRKTLGVQRIDAMHGSVPAAERVEAPCGCLRGRS